MDNMETLGVKLLNLRNEMGLTQNDIAKKIHICINAIDDIEQGKLSNIPAVYMRGYIKAYAEIVHLPHEEYQSYLEALSKDQRNYNKMKDYSKLNKKRKRGKWLLMIFILIIISTVGATAYHLWIENRDNYIEVSHYISPNFTNQISS